MYFKAHRITPVIDGLKIVPAHPQRQWMNDVPLPVNIDGTKPEGKGFANRCLPMLMANQIGYNVVSMSDCVITSLPEGQHITHWKSRPPRVGVPYNNFGNNIVTFGLPWYFETPPGWDVLVIPPPNEYLPRGVTCLSALVETESDHLPGTFTVNWYVEPGISVFLTPGQVVATLVPYNTDAADNWEFTEDDVQTPAFVERSKAKAEVAHKRVEDFTKWHKDYWFGAKRRKIKRVVN